MGEDIDAVVAMHDELIARRGVEVWIGAEPTFTRAESMDPAWHAAADGDDKLARAQRLATAIADRLLVAYDPATGRERWPRRHRRCRRRFRRGRWRAASERRR